MSEVTNGVSNVIKLQRFHIDKILFERMLGHSPSDKKKQIKPIFSRKIVRLEDSVYDVILTVTIDQDTENEKLPFAVETAVGGIFELVGIPEDQHQAALTANASAIVFPYLRSTISTAMSLAGVQPIFLPVMNVDKVFATDNLNVE